jgi:hypothetical protein
VLQITLAAMLGTMPLAKPADPPAPDPNPASLVVPDDVDYKARELVRELGDEYFPAREEAYRDLREMGRMALPAVRDALENSEVPEVVRRCELLLPRAVALDTRARVDCFVADTAGKYKHDLPGADEFFAITGRTDQARTLYRDLMLSPNRELITLLGQEDEVVAAAANKRRIELNPRAAGGLPSSGAIKQAAALDVLAVLFVETTIPDSGGGVGVNAPTYLLTQSQLRVALESDPRKEAMAALAIKWFETRSDPRNLTTCMTTAATLKLPVAITLAKKMLATENATPVQKAQAVCKVAQLGTADDLTLLAPLLEDEGVAFAGVMIVNGQRQNNPVQVRDVALAMSLLLAKKDPTEHGMKSRYANNPAESLKYSYYNFYFEDPDGKVDEAREQAIGDWYKWAGKNVKGYPKAPPPKEKKEEKKEEPKAAPPVDK